VLKLIKVLFVASEGSPFCKTGGLGDVIGSLPKELIKNDIYAGVIMPKYGDISSEFKERMTECIRVTVPLSWRNQYCGLEKIEYEGIPFYFIDNEYYFRRVGMYGFYDEGERFAFFCRAVLEILPYLDFDPDILHCHDWQTALVPVFKKAFYPQLKKPIIFTIHNLHYQGVFPQSVLGDILGLGEEYFTSDNLEYYGKVNYLKGGLLYADVLTTVSPSYAEEIQTPSYGQNLDGVLRQRKERLFGILNGIDYTIYNPDADPHIFVSYNHKTWQTKENNKIGLQKLLGLPEKGGTPLLAVVSRLVNQKGLDLIAEVLDEILALDVQMVVLGTGEEKYVSIFDNAAWRLPNQIATRICFNEILAHKIYAGADIFLMPSYFEPCGLGQMIALRYGSIPVVRETGGLKDTVYPFDGKTSQGNGFTFQGYNSQEMLAVIKKAVHFYYQKDLWSCVVQNAMLTDCSWYRSARSYRSLYQVLIEKCYDKKVD
jgi:starch synthase